MLEFFKNQMKFYRVFNEVEKRELQWRLFFLKLIAKRAHYGLMKPLKLKIEDYK